MNILLAMVKLLSALFYTELKLSNLDCTIRNKFRVVYCTTSLKDTKTNLIFRCSYNRQPYVDCENILHKYILF